MFGMGLGKLFTKENALSIRGGDALHAGISYGPDPTLVPFLCDSCETWFAIFCLPEG